MQTPFTARPDQLNLSPFTEGLVASSLVLGAAFGSIFGVLILPESPRWLASKGRMAEALKIFQKIRSESIAQQELKEIKEHISEDQKVDKISFKDLGTPWIRRIVVLGIALGSISQLVGINSIMYYGTQILENSGFGTKTALIANVANGLIAVVAVIVGMSLLHKVNRRPMLLTGLTGVTVALITIGISASVLEGSPMLPYVVLSMTVIYLAFFQGAIGSMVWLILAEIFPVRLRGIGMGMAVLFLWR